MTEIRCAGCGKLCDDLSQVDMKVGVGYVWMCSVCREKARRRLASRWWETQLSDIPDDDKIETLMDIERQHQQLSSESVDTVRTGGAQSGDEK